ncbi:MAG: hypothetical protein RR782_02765 [Clostridium sp.]
MILNFYCKEKVMTKEEFLDFYERRYGNKPLKLNKKLTTLLIFTFANLMCINNVMAKVNMTKINNFGLDALEVLRVLGYWGCILMCMIELFKSMLSGDLRSISRIIIKYLILFGALYFLPFLFDIIREAF